MRLAWLSLACVAIAACSHPADAPPQPVTPANRADVALPPVPFEDPGACPFEGCLYRQWTATDEVAVYTEQKDEAPLAFTVPRQQKVMALTGVVVTTQAGRVRFRKAVDLSSDSGTIHVEPGQTLYLLTYEGDSDFSASLDGRVYRAVDGSTFLSGACAEEPARCIAEIVAQPEATWWVQVRNAQGQVGWTKEADKFDGKQEIIDPAVPHDN
jgi:hypothetical protein